MWLFLLFVAVPLIEIALFIQVGGLIGLWPTLAIVLVTAIAGSALMRAQGRMALRQVRGAFDEVRDPSEPLAHGAMILFAGALLLTPGFFTDAVGFLLLMPPVRSAAFAWLRKNVKVQNLGRGPGPGAARPPPGAGPGAGRRRDDVLEGEFEDVTPGGSRDGRRPPGSGTSGSGTSGWTRH